jgi:hypothetical protein
MSLNQFALIFIYFAKQYRLFSAMIMSVTLSVLFGDVICSLVFLIGYLVSVIILTCSCNSRIDKEMIKEILKKE